MMQDSDVTDGQTDFLAQFQSILDMRPSEFQAA